MNPNQHQERVRGRDEPTHGRHCRCTPCKREDWTQPHLAPCGMHGPSCPPVYDPWPKPESNQHSDHEQIRSESALLADMAEAGGSYGSVEVDEVRERLMAAADGLLEQLEAAQKAQHVQNLEWAISLAESDPLYAEIFRPYFQKIVDALASNPAGSPKEAS